MNRNRRKFLKESTQYVLGFGLLGLSGSLTGCGGSGAGEGAEETAAQTETPAAGDLFFKISLAQWSLHRTIRDEKALDNLDFAAKARNDFGIEAVEYVNQFFADKAQDQQYLAEMNKRAEDHGVRNVLIMIDGEGNLGGLDQQKRKQAVENHYKWVDAAKFLGCHSIRVNAYGQGSAEEVQKNAIESLRTLGEYAAQENINVIVENHGSYSSVGTWLTGVMESVGMDNVGTLPDFGNFCVKRAGGDLYQGECVEEYDRYKGVREMMPYAKGVSAKSYAFDENGNETQIDYAKMMQIVKDAGYTGYVGIEYEGDELPEEEGIRATKELLMRVGRELS
jgi:sugar phosphate isomerase/epimerase